MSHLPALGHPIDLSASRCIDAPSFIAGVHSCFWAFDRLTSIHLQWSGNYGHREGRFLEGFGSVVWYAGSSPMSFSTKLPARFKAQAWTFEQRWQGLLREFPEADIDQCSCLVLSRPADAAAHPAMVFLEDADDFHTLGDQLAPSDLPAIGARLHPVYPVMPDGHALLEAHRYIAAAWPMLGRLFFSNGNK